MRRCLLWLGVVGIATNMELLDEKVLVLLLFDIYLIDIEKITDQPIRKLFSLAFGYANKQFGDC
jgi:hypothetical protein